MSLRKRIEKIMMAITFAEAGEQETAREIMREESRPRKGKRVTRRPRPELKAPSSRR
jgi:hypothetical protein